MKRVPDLHRGNCLACGAEDVDASHECPDPEYGPHLPPRPFVRRWDPHDKQWVWCMVEHGTAWDYRTRAYTPVQPGESVMEHRPPFEPPLELEP